MYKLLSSAFRLKFFSHVFQIFFIFSLFLNFEDIFKKCEFLYVSDLKRAKIWKYFEKVWVPVHYCSYIYQQGTYKISHQVIFDKFWLLLWKGASSCMFLALLLLTWNIQEHTLFGEKVWVLVCSCQTHIDCRNIQELTPFHNKFCEKVWVPVRSWPIIVRTGKYILFYIPPLGSHKSIHQNLWLYFVRKYLKLYLMILQLIPKQQTCI